ncbi:MAG: hypothetical protein H6737_00315 [Alphaproteobacteria bacterium]|nr:hypothetical protein [Alphaproteobacteria bacterium]
MILLVWGLLACAGLDETPYRAPTIPEGECIRVVARRSRAGCEGHHGGGPNTTCIEAYLPNRLGGRPVTAVLPCSSSSCPFRELGQSIEVRLVARTSSPNRIDKFGEVWLEPWPEPWLGEVCD